MAADRPQRGPSFRTSVIAFLIMALAVAAGATGLLILLDPRTQLWWADRIAEAAAVLRSFFP